MILKQNIHLYIAAFFCVALYGLGVYCRPIFPVDETRYLTVAWEMFTSRDFILPHLNHEAYDHKPPLLFWSINLLWSLFGVSAQAAMAVPFLFAFAFVYVSQRLARHMLPEDKTFPALVTYLLIGSLPFIVYSNMIMFDLVLGVFSILGLTAIWDFAKTGVRRHLVIFALAIGLGAITKGPVILLHVIFPLLCARYWQAGCPVPRARWLRGFTAATLAGILFGLCWAIPAAVKGGPVFADKIFWGQTAGRVTDAFDHQQPFFWYFKFLPVLLLPWIFSPLFWRGLKRIDFSAHREIVRFILVWVPPVFLSFCFISGKQIHYLLPLIPGYAILTGLLFRKLASDFRPRDAWIPFMVMGVLILAPFILKIIVPAFNLAKGRPQLLDALHYVSLPVPLLLFCLASLAVLVLSRRRIVPHVLSLSLSCLLVMVCFQMESRNGFFKNYDLTPVAAVIEKNPGAPLAFTRNYHGEWGFMARLDRPVTEVQSDKLAGWFRQNPNGMAFLRTGHAAELLPYDVIFSMPYKMDNTYNVVVEKGRAAQFAR